jgi:hypothetical protein
MALRISHELARLIRNRAYESGALAKAEHLVALHGKELLLAETERARASSVLDGIDKELRKCGIEPRAIRTIRSTPRRLKLTHGAFGREVVCYLKKAGTPVGTHELVGHLCLIFGFYEGDAARDREWLRGKTTRCLRKIVAKGAVQRIHDPKRNKLGLWLWTGG